MEKYEKISNNKFFKFFEYLYNLIVANMITFLTIVLTLGITTLPALTALALVVKGLKERDEFPIIQTYFLAYKKNFKTMMITEIPFLIFFIIYLFNFFYFHQMLEEYPGIYNEIAYYLTIVIIAVAVLAFTNASIVRVFFPHLDVKKILKYSFVLMKVTSWKVIIMFVVLILYTLLPREIWLTFGLPFIMFSLYYFIYIELIHSVYSKLIPQGYESQKAINYAIELREKKKDKRK